MPDKRCLLHISKFEDFKQWLIKNDIEFRPGKGFWQVLQVRTPNYGWQIVFSRADMKEHYSVNEKLTPLIRQFIEDSKK